MTSDAPPLGSSDILSRYRVEPGVFDEMCFPDRTLRPHWRSIMHSLSEIGSSELDACFRESERLLRENGVTYNIYDDPTGAWRTWSFDPIPLVMDDNEWRRIEHGLIERAEIWDQILRDLYGPRNFVRSGLIPPELVDGDPRYVHHAVNLRPFEERRIHLYAADVARRPDGTFVVLEDKAEAPSGAGYALENRLIISRVFADLYRDAQIHRLAVFFRTMLASFSTLAPEENEEPRMVLLTPGPGNETYFEQAYLAHYLGLTLVEGNDLVVRDAKVWLRTLDGLERVHVILRRIDDAYADPLELRSDSVLGVPGLMQAIRAGTVLVANPPGACLCESPALGAFFPDVARAILGREPILDSTKSWWCGREDDLSHVLMHLDQLFILRRRRRNSRSLIRPAELSPEERARLVESIKLHPTDFAAREIVSLSHSPVLIRGELEPRETVLRAFLVAVGESYGMMPGALTRVAPSRGRGHISNQEGGISKDTWVMSADPPLLVTLLPLGGRQVELRRTGGEIASRVAENLYWFGRYIERAEGTARLLRTLVRRLLEARNADNDLCPPDLLRAITHLTTTYPGFVGDESLLDYPDSELISLVLQGDRAGTLAYDFSSLRRTARSARDRLSDDMWRIVNTLDEDLRPTDQLGDLVEPLDHVIIRLSALVGLLADSMTRGPAFWFVDFGRRIERAMGTLNLLRSVFFYAVQWHDPMAETLLEVADSVMTYRRRYKSRLHPAAVMDLLLTDDQNPRSVAFQLVRLQDLLAWLPSRMAPQGVQHARGLVVQCLGVVRTTDTDTFEWWAEDGSVRDLLDGVLVELHDYLRRVSEAVSAGYFTQVEMPRQLVEIT